LRRIKKTGPTGESIAVVRTQFAELRASRQSKTGRQNIRNRLRNGCPFLRPAPYPVSRSLV